MTITEFLEARIAEDEQTAKALLRDLEGQISEEYAGVVDERGPMTAERLLSAQMWAHYDGQSKRRSFAKGQQIATLANPARVLAECAAKRVVLDLHDGVEDKSWGGAEHDYLWCGSCGSIDDSPVAHPCDTLKALAAIYSTHPDFQQEWAL